MKSSILISSIATLCLMITFAESPRRYGVENKNESSRENTEFVTVAMSNSLPGVIVTADRNKAANSTIVAKEQNYDYLKFDVSDYMETPASEITEETDYSYLKFDVNKFVENTISGSDELPENEYSYLRFDVNNYTDGTTSASIEELPEDEFPNLKFEVSKYYNPDQSNAEDITVLPTDQDERM